MLWQAAYAEFIFLDACWPDFTPAHLSTAIAEFERRERRYGSVSRQPQGLAFGSGERASTQESVHVG
jgi:undecaprenyl diphosphate synthase